MKNPKIIDLISIDNSPPKFYITGDKHRCFDELIEFCKRNKLRPKDVIVILGDSGFNYYGDERDEQLKKQLSAIDVTLFCTETKKIVRKISLHMEFKHFVVASFITNQNIQTFSLPKMERYIASTAKSLWLLAELIA